MLFHDDESLHIRMGIAQDSDHSGFFKRSAPGFSRWIKAEIKIFGSAFRVDVVPGSVVIREIQRSYRPARAKREE